MAWQECEPLDPLGEENIEFELKRFSKLARFNGGSYSDVFNFSYSSLGVNKEDILAINGYTGTGAPDVIAVNLTLGSDSISGRLYRLSGGWSGDVGFTLHLTVKKSIS